MPTALLLVATALAACDDGTAPARDVPSFTIAAAADSVREGDALPVALRWDGAPPPGAVVVAWRVAPASLGLVDAGGTFRSRVAGQGVVSATVGLGAATAVSTRPVFVLPADCVTQVVIAAPLATTVGVGGRTKLGAYTPARTGVTCEGRDSVDIAFRTLDPGVVAVDSVGWVTGLRAGIARVLASPRTRPAVVDTALVSVVAPQPPMPPVANPAYLEMAPGDTQRIAATASLSPNTPPGTTRGVSFASRDTAIATVDAAGLVRAVRIGATSVIVRTLADSAVWVAVPVAVRRP